MSNLSGVFELLCALPAIYFHAAIEHVFLVCENAVYFISLTYAALPAAFATL